jgi:hypothetical protein
MKISYLFFCCLGNGTTVCNKLQEENGDYKTIAHVSKTGRITYYVKNLPQEVISEIKLMSLTQPNN